MKQKNILFCIIAILCVAFLCIEAAIKLYQHNVPAETTIYGNSDNDNSDKPEIYETKAVSDAYLSGDCSALSALDKEIYDKAVEILKNVITEGMTDYEKELAIHDFMVTNITYDTASLEVFGEENENSVNPYGALLNGKAVCTGYTTTFKMFMDMLEIPNLIVYAEDSDREEHAWNMVELEDDWYYVDVTWNDPIPDEDDRVALHKYFNVTEDFMRENDHVWDSSQLPKADSTKYSYENMTGKNSQELDYEIQTMY